MWDDTFQKIDVNSVSTPGLGVHKNNHQEKLYNVISGVTLIFPKSYSAWFLIMGIVIALRGRFLFRNIIVFLNGGNQKMRHMVLQLFSSSLYYALMSYLFVLVQLAENANRLHWSLPNSLARSVCMWILCLVFSDAWLSTILGIYEKKIADFQICFFCTNQYCTPEVTHGWFAAMFPCLEKPNMIQSDSSARLV